MQSHVNAFSFSASGLNTYGFLNQETDDPKPKRALSAYNIFFKHEREEILKATPTRAEGKPRRSHGKIGFADLARTIAGRWKTVDVESKAKFIRLASQDKERHAKEMKEWKEKRQKILIPPATSLASNATDCFFPRNSFSKMDLNRQEQISIRNLLCNIPRKGENMTTTAMPSHQLQRAIPQSLQSGAFRTGRSRNVQILYSEEADDIEPLPIDSNVFKSEFESHEQSYSTQDSNSYWSLEQDDQQYSSYEDEDLWIRTNPTHSIQSATAYMPHQISRWNEQFPLEQNGLRHENTYWMGRTY